MKTIKLIFWLWWKMFQNYCLPPPPLNTGANKLRLFKWDAEQSVVCAQKQDQGPVEIFIDNSLTIEVVLQIAKWLHSLFWMCDLLFLKNPN